MTVYFLHTRISNIIYSYGGFPVSMCHYTRKPKCNNPKQYFPFQYSAKFLIYETS